MIQQICSYTHQAKAGEQFRRTPEGRNTGAWSSDCRIVIIRAMRHLATRLALPLGLCVLSGLPAYAQNKTACELLSKADAEAILGVTLQAPKPTAPFRSLLDPDFTSGTPEQGCSLPTLYPIGPSHPR